MLRKVYNTKITKPIRSSSTEGLKGTPIVVVPERSATNHASYFVNESIDLQVYLQNGEWDLEGTPGKRVVQKFGTDEYHELYFYIHIRRRTLAYGINLIIPSLVISMMTILGFTLPPDACEKITLETTILLSVIFFLQMVSSTSPPQSQSVPILTAFFSCCLMLVACSCVFTVLTLSLHHRKPETHEMQPTAITYDFSVQPQIRSARIRSGTNPHCARIRNRPNTKCPNRKCYESELVLIVTARINNARISNGTNPNWYESETPDSEVVPAGQWTFDTADVDTCHILMRTINAEMRGTTTTTNFGII
uniref:Neurotransmitter-gated ion-channel transmembrane domain-containing protein n=1 Tax=Caenorhabditis japonica TaxID=281687 RepID=A0A8R1E8U0_CAEJA